MSENTIYREALYHAAQKAKKHRGMPKEGCKHWFIPIKHACGPATKVCQDCGDERAL